MAELCVRLSGTRVKPELGIKVGFRTPLPTGGSAHDWVKARPGQRWDPTEQGWYITALGIAEHPDDVLAAKGITVEYPSTGELAGLDPAGSLDELWRPAIVPGEFDQEWIVHPRLSGFEDVKGLLGAGAVWNREAGAFIATPTDVLSLARHLSDRLDEGVLKTIEAEAAEHLGPWADPSLQDAAAVLARHNGVDDGLDASIDAVAETIETIPGWFGLGLRPYQEAGAYAMVAGRPGMCDEPGSGKCLLPNTSVLVNGQYIRIEDLWEQHAQSAASTPDVDGVGEIIALTPGQVRVQALNGRPGKALEATTVDASHLYRQHITSKVKSVRTASGAQVVATLPHRFLTPSGWRSDIQAGDMIAVPDNTPFEVTHPETTIEMARFLAWQIGEGYERQSHRLSITNNDVSRLESLQHDFETIVRQADLGEQKRPRIYFPKDRCPNLVGSLPAWTSWITARGYRFGQLAAGKSVPDFIMGASLEVQREFLGNYFSAEGSYSLGHSTVEIASASRKLMIQLQTMLSRFGVAMNIGDRQKCATNGSRIKRTYTIGFITGADVITFRDRIDFADDVKSAKLATFRPSSVSNISRRIPCLDVVAEFVAAGVPSKAFARTGSLTPSNHAFGRLGVTDAVARQCVSALQDISTGAMRKRYADAPKHRWSYTTIDALDTIDAARAAWAAQEVEAMMSPSIRWTKVIGVEHASYEGYVYDLTIPDGANYIAEGLWCHNTRQALAAAAILRTRRLIVVAPPLVLTNWARETQQAMEAGWRLACPDQDIAVNGRGQPHPDSFGPYVRVIRAGRKSPGLPEVGAVIVPDSLLASRPELLEELIDWGADAVVFDEVHRARTWDNKRSTAARRLANTVPPGRRFPMTGTPLLASPHEMVNFLQITGLLGPVFGGPGPYLERYTSEDRFGGRFPRRKNLTELGQLLDGKVWVRRTKTDILPDLPDKIRAVAYVDVDTAEYRLAHAELYLKALDWADEQKALGAETDFAAAKAWAKDTFGLSTPLRVAAGVAKVPAAIEWITDWLEQTTVVKDGAPVCTRPLVVWAHHKQVVAALHEAITTSGAGADVGVGVIDGSTSSVRRQQIADDFQSGKISVLICSIIAAGFGITLTRSSDAVFVEQDWTPANIVQAEDRLHRFTQQNSVLCTTLLAEGTLDAAIRSVLTTKSGTLAAVMAGSDTAVTEVAGGIDDQMFDATLTEADVVASIVVDALQNPPSKAELTRAEARMKEPEAHVVGAGA